MWNSDKNTCDDYNSCSEQPPPVLLQEQPEQSLSPHSNSGNSPNDKQEKIINSPNLLSPSAPTLSAHNQELSDHSPTKSNARSSNGNYLMFVSESDNHLKREYVDDSLSNESVDQKASGTSTQTGSREQELRAGTRCLSSESSGLKQHGQVFNSSPYMPLHILDESSMEHHQSSSAPVSQHITPRQTTPIRSYGSGGLPRESLQHGVNVWSSESPSNITRNRSMKQEPIDPSSNPHLPGVSHHPYSAHPGTARGSNSHNESALRQPHHVWPSGTSILQSLNAQSSPVLQPLAGEPTIGHAGHPAARPSDFSPGPSNQYRLSATRGIMPPGQAGFVPPPLGSQAPDPASYQRAQLYKTCLPNNQAVMAAAFAQQQQQQQIQGSTNWPVSNNKPSPNQQIPLNQHQEFRQSPSCPGGSSQINRSPLTTFNEGSPTELLRQMVEVAREHDIKVQQQVALYVERDMSGLVDALIATRNRTNLPSDNSSSTVEMDNLFRSLCTFLEQSLFYMVEWVRKTNLFRKVPVEDQMQLLHSGWSEVLLMEYLHHYLLYFKDRSLIHHMDGLESSVDLLELLNQSDSKIRLLDLLDRFEQLDLDANEFTCLKFMLLFNPGKHDLNIRSSLGYIEDVQSILFNYLNDYIYRKYSDRPERFGQMILRLPEVKYLSFQLETYLLAKYYSGGIPQQTLLTEMLLTKRMICETSNQERGTANREPSSFSSADNSCNDIRSMS